MNKFNEVENLAKELGCSYESAFDIVYGIEDICEEDEIDYAL